MSAEDEKKQKLIDGNATAAAIRQELAAEIAALPEAAPKPKLTVVLVGERKDSQTYVRMKTKACAEVGIVSDQRDIPADVTQDDLLALVGELNADPTVNGILVQLPLPKHIDEEAITEAISHEKDADGLHTVNLGKLVVYGDSASLVPCTPKGCLELLDRYKVDIKGKHACVVGRSKLVGKPIAALLLSRHATVTQCHSRTPNLAEEVGRADIVVSAMGRAEAVKGEWIKEGAVVIDVGINAVDDATKKRGYRLVGDVEFASAVNRARLITPVPGGVGPMTVAMLLRNTFTIYKKMQEKK